MNEVTITFPSEEIYVVELEPLLGSCKLESGLKHAHAEVIVERGGFASCRVHTRDSAAIVGEPKVITPAMASFIPITLGAGRVNLILLLNRGEQEGVFRARLFFGKRSPEATWVIPPRGSRVVMVEAEFSSYISLEKGEQVQAYVRLSTKSGELGVQTLERTEGGKEEAFYASIS